MKKRKVTKKLIVEVALVAKRPGEIKKIKELAPTVERPKETGRLEKAEELKEAKKPGVIKGTREPMLVVEGSKKVGRPEETGIMGVSKLAERRPEEAERLRNQ